eukprot:7154599-Prymnesium_polylepis.1
MPPPRGGGTPMPPMPAGIGGAIGCCSMLGTPMPMPPMPPAGMPGAPPPMPCCIICDRCSMSSCERRGRAGGWKM